MIRKTLQGPLICRLFIITAYLKGENIKTFSAGKAKINLDQLIDLVEETHIPIIISGNRTNAVLISEDDWKSIQESLHTLTIQA